MHFPSLNRLADMTSAVPLYYSDNLLHPTNQINPWKAVEPRNKYWNGPYGTRNDDIKAFFLLNSLREILAETETIDLQIVETITD
jgi:hypothetical protein